MRSLFTVNLDRYFRAGHSAQSTSGASPVYIEANRVVPFGVIFIGGGYQGLLAGSHAKKALFAKFLVDFYVSFQFAIF